MDVTLPSGAVVTLRDKLTAKDKFAVQAAVHFSLDTTTGMQVSTGSILNDMRNALLKTIITSWTFGTLIPSAAAEDTLADLDLDDYDALADAVEPLLQKVTGSGPNRPAPSSS
jgi:hypothetical protein